MKPLLPLGENGLTPPPTPPPLPRNPPEPRGRKGGLSMLRTLSMTPPPDELVIGNSWGGRILIVELLLQVDTLPEAAAQHEACNREMQPVAGFDDGQTIR